MKITYDSEVDALYIRFLEITVTTHHVAEGIAVGIGSHLHISFYKLTSLRTILKH